MSQSTPVASVQPLPPEKLRWRCDPARFAFETTAEVEPLTGIVGQDAAIEALEFGLECFAAGQNIFVRGLTGTGRMALVERVLDEVRPVCPLAGDYVYVRNFEDPIRPRLISLGRGEGGAFGRAIDRLIDFISDDLPKALNSEPVRARVKGLEATSQGKIKELAEPLEKKLAEVNLALVSVMVGQVARPALFPRINGQPMAPEEFEAARGKGEISDEVFDQIREAVEAHRGDVEAFSEKINEIMEEHSRAAEAFYADEIRSTMRPMVAQVRRRFDHESVRTYLAQIVEDLASNRLSELDESDEFLELYRANVITAHGEREGCPVVTENSPTVVNLIGGFERHLIKNNKKDNETADHMAIRGGSLLRADGGYLILEARDVLSEPGAWRALVRTLRTNTLEIAPPELPWLSGSIQLKPEPIPVTVKVILVGDGGLYYMLDNLDPDFAQLFKVLAEFDSVIERSQESLDHYAGIIRRIADEDELPPFGRDAVAALAEHGCRIASSGGELTTRFNRLADIAREAGFITRKAGRSTVTGEDILETVRRTKRRANLASRKFRTLLSNGTIRVDTTGRAVGQINGLAVIHAGPLLYGFPARVTAAIGPGSRGVINIEGEAALSGAIHTKGFHILGGLLRTLLGSSHPLAFEASIAFEQSYGGIDGDSASGAETWSVLHECADRRARFRQDRLP